MARPHEKHCPQCGKYMVIKGKKLACSDPQCGYTEDYTEKNEEWDKYLQLVLFK